MNYGSMLGASSVLTSMFRQDVAANNLANVETVGFKPDVSFTIPRQAARQEDGLMNLPSNALLERLGAGVFLAPTRTRFTQGAITRTGNPLDLAIEGDGFIRLAGAGSGDKGSVRLTRDGRLTINAQGTLVTASSGAPVADATGRPITLERNRSVNIDVDGTIRQGGAVVATIGVVDLASKSSLRKLGDNVFEAPASVAGSLGAAGGRLLQGAVERSAVDPVQAMLAVQNAANSVGTAVRIMQINDELAGRAINTLGRVTT